MNRPGWTHRSSWILMALLGATLAARAGDDRRGPGVALLPRYQQECAACHVAFPPGMLPADSWRRLMNDLPRHFGTDASLDAATDLYGAGSTQRAAVDAAWDAVNVR